MLTHDAKNVLAPRNRPNKPIILGKLPVCLQPFLTDWGTVARHSPATDSSSTRESCILGIVIELLRIDRGGWVALFPGNCSTYGFVDIR